MLSLDAHTLSARLQGCAISESLLHRTGSDAAEQDAAELDVAERGFRSSPHCHPQIKISPRMMVF